jgi:hypothetical protein
MDPSWHLKRCPSYKRFQPADRLISTVIGPSMISGQCSWLPACSGDALRWLAMPRPVERADVGHKEVVRARMQQRSSCVVWCYGRPPPCQKPALGISCCTGKPLPACVPLSHTHRLCAGASRAHVVLLCAGRLAQPATIATARLVGQPLQAPVQKPLEPFIDKAAADPDRGSDLSKRHPIGG